MTTKVIAWEQRELAKCWKDVKQKKVGQFMLQNSADWIQWKRNPSLTSYMGGVWERQIRSARNILLSLMNTHGASLVEVEGIVNSRPLVVETINGVNSQAALSPSHILTMKSKVVMPSFGVFGTPNLYCRKRWGRDSISVTSFEVVGKRNFLLLFKTGRNGKHH